MPPGGHTRLFHAVVGLGLACAPGACGLVAPVTKDAGAEGGSGLPEGGHGATSGADAESQPPDAELADTEAPDAPALIPPKDASAPDARDAASDADADAPWVVVTIQ